MQLDLFGASAVTESASAVAAAPEPPRIITCPTCKGAGAWKSPRMAETGTCPASTAEPCRDCAGEGTRTILPKAPCPPEAVAHARTEYDHKAVSAMLEFSREAKRLGLDHRCCTTSGEGRFCKASTARLANEILRGVASDRPALTEERWDEAREKLPGWVESTASGQREAIAA